MIRVAILDDYQRVALEVADWSALDGRAQLTVFDYRLGDEDAVAAVLAEFDVVVAMRERTSFSGSLLHRLPRLRLLVTTGMRNSAIDVATAERLGIAVCGTGSRAASTVELTWGSSWGGRDTWWRKWATWPPVGGRPLSAPGSRAGPWASSVSAASVPR